MAVGLDLVVRFVHVGRDVVLHVRTVRDLVILRRKIDRAVGHVKRYIGFDSVVSRDVRPADGAGRTARARAHRLERHIGRPERPPRWRRLRRRVSPRSGCRGLRSRSSCLGRTGRGRFGCCGRLGRRGRLSSGRGCGRLGSGLGRAGSGRFGRGARNARDRVELGHDVRRHEAVVDVFVIVIAIDVVVLGLLRVGQRVDVLAVDWYHVAVRIGIVRLVRHVFQFSVRVRPSEVQIFEANEESQEKFKALIYVILATGHFIV